MDTKQIQEISELNEDINKKLEVLKKLHEECMGRDEEKSHPEEKTLLEENRELAESIYSIFDKAEKNKKIIVGNAYLGVLVSHSLTCRRGEVYYYRCRSSPDSDWLEETIGNHADEVKSKIGEEDFKRIYNILKKIKKEEEREIRNKINHFNQETKIEPENIIEVDVDYRDRIGVKQVRINTIRIDGTNIEFKGEETVNSRFTEKFLKSKYKYMINILAEQFNKELKEIKDRLRKELEEINELGAKWLISANLE